MAVILCGKGLCSWHTIKTVYIQEINSIRWNTTLEEFVILLSRKVACKRARTRIDLIHHPVIIRRNACLLFE